MQNDLILPLSLVEMPREINQQSIPAQVFLNHFFGLHFHLQHTTDAQPLAQLERLQHYRPIMTEERTELAKKMLLNSWNTEYALKTTAHVGDDNYLRYALHWTFPQAYYSVVFGLRAFLATQGTFGNYSQLFRQRVGQMVVNGWYPREASFYAVGDYGHYNYARLSLAHHETPSLLPAATGRQAQAQIRQFLKTSRDWRAKNARQRLQADPAKALRNKAGGILQKFERAHWQQITPLIGPTSYFDLMARLRISANHREIERFVEANIDFKQFHASLAYLVAYFNGIHECYVAQAFGLAQYQEFVASLPPYLRKGFVQQRYESLVLPALSAQQSTWQNVA
jgi:hypothetical protein